jgi:hypothetical protein
MSTVMASAELRSIPAQTSILDYSARFWFAAMVVGQLAFGVYIIAFYGGAAVSGTLSEWNRTLPRGYVEGDVVGNLVLATHLLMAAYLTLGGLLQLVPQIRTRAPRFHRWNGRTYVAMAILGSATGLYFLWSRGTIGDTTQHVGISINALVIFLCAGQAWRYAMARNFEMHRCWALRLLLTTSGVWFFRVGLMMWVMVNQGPAGFDPKTFTGPALSVLSFAQWLLPLAVLELYLRAQRSISSMARTSMATLLIALTLLMCVGIFGAMGRWLARLSS